jgi:hypothetical protein
VGKITTDVQDLKRVKREHEFAGIKKIVVLIAENTC